VAQLFDRAKDLVRVPAALNPLAPLPDDDGSEIEEEELQMTLVEHLDELRKRLVRSAMGIGVATAIAFLFTPRLLEFLLSLGGLSKAYTFEPQQAFLTFFQVALMTGIGLSSPWILYQVFAFVVPALTRREKRLLYSFLPLVAIFFCIGIAFGCFVTVPFALKYLLGFTLNGLVEPLIGINSYISFVTTFLLWMGLSFELPIIIFFLSKTRIVNVKRLVAYRKYAILAAFILAAVITPTPDPLNQIIVAIPLWILYEVGILLARIA
jgi:sec-independent protein translocase protein TatC